MAVYGNMAQQGFNDAASLSVLLLALEDHPATLHCRLQPQPHHHIIYFQVLLLTALCPCFVSTDDDNDAVLFEKIKKGNYDADDPIWEHISADAKDIVAKLLTVDSAKRLTAEQALNHPWVQGKVPATAGLADS